MDLYRDILLHLLSNQKTSVEVTFPQLKVSAVDLVESASYCTLVQIYRQMGMNVHYYRKRKRLTQAELAEMVDIERVHMGNIELARTGTSLDVIFRIADALEIPVHKLFEFRD